MGLVAATAGSLLGKALAFLFLSPSGEDREATVEETRKHLEAKYRLESLYSFTYMQGGTMASSGCTFSQKHWHWDRWRPTIVDLVERILAYEALTDEGHQACGDLALFFVVIDGHHYFPKSREFLASETWRSLAELGRGRGGEYALRLVQEELREHCEESDLLSG